MLTPQLLRWNGIFYCPGYAWKSRCCAVV